MAIYAQAFLADVVAGHIKSCTATVGEVVGQLRARLVSDFNVELQLDAADMCSTFTIPEGPMDSKLADVFPPGQDTSSLLVFVVPPPNFIPSQLKLQDIRLEIQELKRQHVWAQKEREFEKRHKEIQKKELQDLRTEISSLRQDLHFLHIRIVLDSARRKVLDVLQVYQNSELNWGCLRSQFADTADLYEWLCRALPQVDYRPSDEALRLLCQHSDLREAGTVAHHADKDKLALAISRYDGLHREELILLFEFAFGERFYL